MMERREQNALIFCVKVPSLQFPIDIREKDMQDKNRKQGETRGVVTSPTLNFLSRKKEI